MRELRLELDGPRLVFPDGKPACLACGAEPAGVRRVWFEELPAGAGLSRLSSTAAGAEAIRNRIAFDAPLCRAHRARARRLSLGAGLCALAGVGLLILGVTLLGGRKPKSLLTEWGPMALALLGWVPAYFFWRKKDRGGLSCEARRDGENGLLLNFPD